MSETKISVLEAVLKNYSQTQEEKELIQTIIAINPWLLLPLEEKKSRINSITMTFDSPIAIEMKNILHNSIKGIKNKKFAAQEKKKLLKEYPLVSIKK